MGHLGGLFDLQSTHDLPPNPLKPDTPPPRESLPMSHQVFTECPAPTRHRADIDERTDQYSLLWETAASSHQTHKESKTQQGWTLAQCHTESQWWRQNTNQAPDSLPSTPQAATASESWLLWKGRRSMLGTQQLLAA